MISGCEATALGARGLELPQAEVVVRDSVVADDRSRPAATRVLDVSVVAWREHPVAGKTQAGNSRGYQYNS